MSIKDQYDMMYLKGGAAEEIPGAADQKSQEPITKYQNRKPFRHKVHTYIDSDNIYTVTPLHFVQCGWPTLSI